MHASVVRRYASLAAALTLTLALTACGKDSKAPTPEAVAAAEARDANRRKDGDSKLVPRIERLIHSKYVETCDETLAALKRELGTALDAREDEIRAWIEKNPRNYDTGYKRVPLGKSTALEQTKEPARPSGPEEAQWQSEHYGWLTAGKLYNKIKDTPVDVKWAALNSWVRSLVVDDQDRLEYAINPFLDHVNIQGLPELREAVHACVDSKDCSELKLGEKAKALLEVPYYDPYSEILNDPKASAADRRAAIEKLAKDVEVDFAHRSFVPRSPLRRIDAKTLEVQLVSGDFAGAEKQLADYVEKMWTSDALSIHVAWSDSASQAYRFLFDNEAGARAFTSSDHTIHLTPDILARAIAHEVGHAVGFPDHYYTVWERDTCRYRNEVNPSDIMSDHTTGYPTPSEWKELSDRY